MLAFNRRTRIFVCKEATDMRSLYDYFNSGGV